MIGTDTYTLHADIASVQGRSSRADRLAYSRVVISVGVIEATGYTRKCRKISKGSSRTYLYTFMSIVTCESRWLHGTALNA